MTKHFIAIILFLGTFAQAQMPTTNSGGDGKISGNLIDSLSNDPIEFATLALFKVKDLSKPIDGTVTDDKGKFTLKNLAEGKYAVKFTSIGFKDKTIFLEEITSKNRVINLKDILLSTDAKVLNEVVVTGQGAVVEERVDRLIYNADKDIASKGGDASDVLRKVPLLSVDLDGNVSLRGSSSIRVLINNKPSTIMAASVADALKQIPADQIKTVEVITSPSSKYDAEGSTGIINIITKKNNLEGYSLSTNLGAGNRGGNLGLNGSLRAGKFGMTLGGWGRMGFNPAKTTFEQSTKSSEKIYKTVQDGTSNDQMSYGRYSIGADYDISKTKSLSGGARFGTRSSSRNQDLGISRFEDATLLSNTLQRIESITPSNSWDFNIDYLHIIKPQKEFSISTLYSRSTANSDFTNTPIGNPELEKFALTNNNNNLNQEFTFQMDYQTPIKKNQLIEFGGKGIFRLVNSDFSYLIGGVLIEDPKRPNGSLDYNQNIGATYIAYTYSTKSKYTFKVGTRYEITDIKATQNANTEINIDPYNILVPNVNISKTFGGKYTVKTAYNRRIQRPGLQQLNPNSNQVNPQNIQIGNPELKPELTDNIEASVSASIKKIYLNLSLFSRSTNNSITQVTNPSGSDNGVVITSYQNIGQDKAYGLNFSGNLSLTSKWMVNAGIESFYNYITGQTASATGVSIPLSNEGWNVSGRLMTFITLPKGWQVQAFSFARGSRVLPMGRQGGFGYYSFGSRKEFNNKKGSIGLSAQNFLASTMKIRTNLESPLFSQSSVNYMYNRGISLNFSYKIGKMGVDAMQPKKRSKGVKNDDVKDGGADTGNQQSGGAPAGRN
ncbi:TonB-dependent receptor [Lacihabitans sp. LS3-19]|uniref:TonB-dependent receptor domain-containing protein n=1 Tax=Lacihabitans sp. LS3-19 TaxID=2487335 RepID=UPI0020CD7A4C|nr:TonB-dependent receptor [Lacihabitans sp. LS3-19]MCP9770541.1 TonB-dependent receptor [Lacihabitans sp. LS3-19]